MNDKTNEKEGGAKANAQKSRGLGSWGEEAACSFLEKRGWSVAARNWRCRFGELDIVAVRDGILAFIEVKTRSRGDFGLPREAVNREKQRKLRVCAELFMRYRKDLERLQPRMDVIEIVRTDAGAVLRHFENAF